jgi:transcriptional regulator with XRE-family HTH domain
MPSKERTGLAARLKSLRDKAGMTQQQVATAAGLSMSLITQLEQGSKSDPRLSTLRALAGALGVSLDELTGDGGQAEKPKRKRGK